MPFNSLSVKPIDQQDGTLVVNPVQQYSGVQNLNVAQYSNPINQPGVGINIPRYSEDNFVTSTPNLSPMAAFGQGLANVAGGVASPIVTGMGETFNRVLNAPIQATGMQVGNAFQGKPLQWLNDYNRVANDLTTSFQQGTQATDRTLGTNLDASFQNAYDHPKTTAALSVGSALFPTASSLLGGEAAATTAPALYNSVKGAQTAAELGFGAQALSGVPGEIKAYNEAKGDDKVRIATEGIANTLLGGLAGYHGTKDALPHVIRVVAQGGERATNIMNEIAANPELMNYVNTYAPTLVSAIANGDHATAIQAAGSLLFRGTPGFAERAATGEKPETLISGAKAYEVDDSNASLNRAALSALRQGQEVTLDELLNHDKLKAADPEAFKAKVVQTELPANMNGYFDRNTNTILLNDRQTPTAKQLSTIMHESTHEAQHRAGIIEPQHVIDPAQDMEGYHLSHHEADARTVANRLDIPKEVRDQSPFYDPKTRDFNLSAARAQHEEMNNQMASALNDPLYSINPGKRSTDQILKERKDAADQLTERDLRSKARNFHRAAVTKILESQPELFRYDRQKAKLGTKPAMLDSLVHHSDVLSRSGDIANKFMRDNGLNATVEGVTRAGLDPETLGQYAADKHIMELAAEGRKVSNHDLRESKQVVEDLGPQYEPFRKNLTDYSHKLVDLLHEAGLINDGAHEYLQTHYTDYVPLQRLFSPDEMDAMRSGNGAAATITKQTIVRRLEGSSREIKNPIESLIQMTNAATKQVEKNRGANIIYRDALTHGDKLGLTVLRNADDQRHLTEIYKESSDLRAQRDKNQKTISRQSAQARKLATEINNLERKGLLVRLKEGSNEVAGKGEAFRYETREAVVRGKEQTHLTIRREPTASETRAMVEGLINSDPSTLRRIRNMQALRQGKHEAIMNKVDELKAETDQIKADLKDRYSEASLLHQAEQKGKAIVTGHDNGTKFVVEVPRPLRQSLDNQTREAPSDLVKALSPFARVSRMGATALNLGFSIVANVLKDPVSGFVNSAHGMRMFDPRTWSQALAVTVKPHGALAEELHMNEMYLKTYYDSGRQETKMTVDEMASHASPAARAKFLATHPDKTIGATEDLMSFGERFNRNWQAMTYLYGGKAKGMVGDELTAYMQKGAWKNTVDFNRGGTVTRELNMIDQFLNAAVQGSRTLGSSIRERPVETMTKIGLVAGVIPALVTLHNMQDENKKIYGYIPDYEKQSNLIFILPGASRDPQTGKLDGVIKIPMSNEIARIADITRLGVEAHVSDGTLDPKKVIADAVQSATGMNVDSKMAFVGNFTPQAAKDVIEPMMNKSMFTGQPIVPDYMKDLPADQQVYKTTSGSARAIGGALGISPLIVQNFIGSQFGTVGKEIEGLVDKGLAAHGDIPQEQATSKTIVDDIVNRVYGSTGPSDKALVAQAMTNGLNAITNPQDKQFAKAMLAKNDDKNFLDSTDRNGMLLNSFMGNKQLYNFFKGLNDANISVGKPADPFYQLSPDQQAKVLFYRSQGVARDAGQDYTKNGESLYKSLGLSDQWYQDYSKQNDNFFKQLDAQNTANGVTTTSAPRSLDGSVRPKATDEQQSLMDAYNALPQHDGPKGGSKTRSLWIQSHPDEWAKIQDFYAGQDAFTNNERGKLGLDTVDYTSGSGGSSGGSSGSGTYRVGSGYGGSKKYSDYVGGGGYSDYKGTNGYRESRTAGKMTISSGVKMPGGGTISINDHEPAWKSKKATIRITKGIPKKSKIA